MNGMAVIELYLFLPVLFLLIGLVVVAVVHYTYSITVRHYSYCCFLSMFILFFLSFFSQLPNYDTVFLLSILLRWLELYRCGIDGKWIGRIRNGFTKIGSGMKMIGLVIILRMICKGTAFFFFIGLNGFIDTKQDHT